MLLLALTVILLLSVPYSGATYIASEPPQRSLTALSVDDDIVIKLQLKYQDEKFWKIAWCESRLKSYAKNPSSSASSLFQIINKSWNYYGEQYWGDDFINRDVFDPIDNTELAWYMYQKDGDRHWYPSKKCWSNYY